MIYENQLENIFVFLNIYQTKDSFPWVAELGGRMLAYLRKYLIESIDLNKIAAQN